MPDAAPAPPAADAPAPPAGQSLPAGEGCSPRPSREDDEALRDAAPAAAAAAPVSQGLSSSPAPSDDEDEDEDDEDANANDNDNDNEGLKEYVQLHLDELNLRLKLEVGGRLFLLCALNGLGGSRSWWPHSSCSQSVLLWQRMPALQAAFTSRRQFAAAGAGSHATRSPHIVCVRPRQACGMT